MSLSATLSNALSGLSAAQRALSVTANNVANANTDGYSRKQINQATQIVDGQSSGVRSLEPTRVVDRFLSSELRRQESVLGRDGILAEAFERIERGILGAPGEADRGLSAHLGKLSGLLEQLANEPESQPLRTAALGAIEDMLRQVQGDVATVRQLRSDADQRIGQTVQSINADLQELHVLNQEIVRTGGTADLEDRRDLVLNQLAQKIEISTFSHDNGSIAVYTSGGHALLEQSPRILHYEPASSVGGEQPFKPIRILMSSDLDPTTGMPLSDTVGEVLVTGGYRAVQTPEMQAAGQTDLVVSPLTGGSLQGLIEVRDRVLPELRDQLAEVANLFAYNLNKAHNGAMPHPLPAAVQGSRVDFTSFPTAPADLSGTASLVVFASDGTVAADIALTMAGATDPVDIVNQIIAGLGGLGTVTFTPGDGLSITMGVDGGGEPYRLAWDEGDSRIVASDEAGHAWAYGFAHYFGLNDVVVRDGGAAGAYALRGDLAADSRLLSNVVLSRDAGVPGVGGVGDKRGLQRLAGALDAEATTVARGGLAPASTTVSRYVSDMTGLVAAQSGQAQNREAASRALVEDLEFRQGAVSGVNLDEELAKLVLYQQAYSVSARLISITNDLFGELVNIVR
jgi:flagellar hook-associated protein 1 FlgK